MAMQYVGGGAFIHGVPARDLSDVEEEKFAEIIAEQERLTGTKLYEPAQDVAPFVVEDDEDATQDEVLGE